MYVVTQLCCLIHKQNCSSFHYIGGKIYNITKHSWFYIRCSCFRSTMSTEIFQNTQTTNMERIHQKTYQANTDTMHSINDTFTANVYASLMLLWWSFGDQYLVNNVNICIYTRHQLNQANGVTLARQAKCNCRDEYYCKS